MGAARQIRAILKDKKIKQTEFAEMADMPCQSLRNTLCRDTMFFETAERYADLLGCDIVFRDRESGKLYE